MIIKCENCETRFRVNEEKLGTTGRMVRCASCSHVWHQEPSKPIQAKPALEEHQTPTPQPEEPSLAEDPRHEVDTTPNLRDVIQRPEGRFDDKAESNFDRRSRLRQQLSGSEFDGNDPNLPAATEDKGSIWKRLGWLSLAVLLVVLLINLYVWRDEISKRYARAEAVYQTLGLIEANDTSSAKEVDPTANLRVTVQQSEAKVVDGAFEADIPITITNTGSKDVVIPLMYAVLCDSLAQELKSWTIRAPATRVAPGKTIIAQTKVEDVATNATSLRIIFERDFRRLRDTGTVCGG